MLSDRVRRNGGTRAAAAKVAVGRGAADLGRSLSGLWKMGKSRGEKLPVHTGRKRQTQRLLL